MHKLNAISFRIRMNNSNLLFLIPKTELATFLQILSQEEIEYDIDNEFNLEESVTQIINFLTVGGGIVGAAKCIIEYLKIKHQNSKIRVKKKSGEEIEIEIADKDLIKSLLQDARLVIIDQEGKDESIK